MAEPTWPQIGLFGISAVSGNLGLMMLTGFVPMAPGTLGRGLPGTLLVLSFQCLVILAIALHLQEKEHLEARKARQEESS